MIQIIMALGPQFRVQLLHPQKAFQQGLVLPSQVFVILKKNENTDCQYHHHCQTKYQAYFHFVPTSFLLSIV